MPSTLAKPSTPIPLWAKALAWQQRWRMAAAQICHLQRNNLSSAKQKTACVRFFHGRSDSNF
jgi:hypothetical protein